MSTNTINTSATSPALLEQTRGVKWNCILAGVAVALGSQILLNFLGAGFGLIIINSASANLPTTIATTGLIWLTFSGILSLAYAGWITGHLTNSGCKSFLAIHGLLVWCLATIVTTAVTSTALGAAIGGPVTLLANNLVHLIAKFPRPVSEIGLSILSNKGSLNQINENASAAVTQAFAGAGKVSLSLFGAYFLSALAAAAAAICGRRKSNYYP